jgi:hypothetical protein
MLAAVTNSIHVDNKSVALQPDMLANKPADAAWARANPSADQEIQGSAAGRFIATCQPSEKQCMSQKPTFQRNTGPVWHMEIHHSKKP